MVSLLNWYPSFSWILCCPIGSFIFFQLVSSFGGFIFHLESSLVQLIHSFVQLVLWSIWLLASSIEASSPCYLLQSLILNIVWFPPSIRHWICAFDSTRIMRNAHLMEELSLYWPSKFFTHFGNWCQWGRSFEGLRELAFMLGGEVSWV